ncbi:MAG: LPS-assembly protein LptD [Hyphomicrobiaceae bacterium]|nr:LPS-assembly protein LptD [Hyphomicrobiaceae bacterium]
MIRGGALTLTAVLTVGLTGTGTPAYAQDPSLTGGPNGTVNRAAKPFRTDSADLLPSTKVDASKPLYLQGDQLVYDNDGNSVVARGNVEIYFNDYILTAEEVVYDQGAGTLTAVGNVILKEPNGNVIRADRYTLTDDFRDGFVQQLSSVAKDDTRIAAERATRRDGNVTEFSNARFSPCKSPDGVPPLWCISGARIIHDQQAATVTYQDAQFEVFGVPVVYLPYFQHPDPSVKRRSGFLFPSFGNSDDLGFMTTIPYYFALDPSYDFTFKPRYMTGQGVMWGGEWRQKLANGEYKINFAAIDQDRDNLPNPNASPGSVAALQQEARLEALDGWRGTVDTKGLFSLGSWWKWGWDVTVESDDTFRRFYKFDSRLLTDRVNQVFLDGVGNRSYFGATLYHFGGLLLDDTDRSESLVHPVIDHNYVFDETVAGGELRWNSSVVSLTREDRVNQVNPVTGLPLRDPNTGALLTDGVNQAMNRAVTEVAWRRELIDAVGITYTPFANLRGDIYQLNEYVDAVTGELESDQTYVRGVASAGATVAYPWVASTSLASHTIEPIGQIVTRAARDDQRSLPNEDAQSLVFDDTNLFEIDKFSGYDRVETGTRVNAGVQYTFQPNWGGYARLLAGQSFQIAGNNPFENPGFSRFDDAGRAGDQSLRSFNPNSGLQTDSSDYVLGAYIAPTTAFRIISQSRFNETDLELQRQDIFAQVTYGPVILDTTYAFTAANPEFGREEVSQDISAGASLALTDRWTALARVRYDIDDDMFLSNQFSLRYSDECFILTATYLETHFRNVDLEPDHTVFLRFAFKHLGEFDYKTDVLDTVFGDQQPPDR